MTDKRKPIPRTDPDQFPCPLCGSDDYEFGRTHERIMRYEPMDESFVARLWKKAKPFDVVNINCRVCRNCGHMLFLVDDR